MFKRVMLIVCVALLFSSSFSLVFATPDDHGYSEANDIILKEDKITEEERYEIENTVDELRDNGDEYHAQDLEENLDERNKREDG